MIKVFGHKSPDTDSTGSAIIWAWALQEMGQEAKACLLGEPNSEAAFVLKRWGYEKPEIISDVAAGEEVVIVDTNNPAELPDNINEASIVEIIDHHLLVGGLKTKQPIKITMKPLASAASIMAQILGEKLNDAPSGIKGLVLSCVLSDTLAFRSPTTTEYDVELGKKLAADLGLSIDDYAGEMFAAKSDVSSFDDAELLRMDSKIYEVEDTKFRVSVLETTSPQTVLDRKDTLISAMSEVAAADDVDQVLLFIVDILNEESTLLVPNDLVKSVANASFDAAAEGDTVVLPGVVSRKKQIIPNLKL